MKRILYTISLIVSISGFAQDPVAQYVFSGGAKDSSPNLSNGTVNGATLTTDRFTAANSAYLFDGVDDDISVADASHLDIGTSDYSISFWMNSSNSSALQQVVSKANLTNGYEVRTDDFGRIFARVNDEFGLSTAVVADGVWHKVTVVVDRDVDIRIYVDGMLDGTATVNTASADLANSENLIIGSNGSSQFFDGSIDHVRIYDEALSGNQVSTLLKEDQILATYSFEGNTMDGTGNEHNGIASGATPTSDRFDELTNAYFFGGSSTMTFDNTANLDFGNEITVATWVKPSVYGVDGAGEPEFLSNGSGSMGFDFKLSGGTSTEKGLKAEIFGSGVFLVAGSLNLDTWYHVAFSYKRNGSLVLYVDGEEVGSTAAVDQAITVSTNALVAGNSLNGSIDELQIYDRTLGAAEIASLFAAESPDGPFITTWETTTVGESITIPTTGAGYDYLVDWGDGTSESGLTGNASHTYASAGVYTVAITGDFPRIFFTGSSQIRSVEQWGRISWTSFEGAFNTCSNLVVNATDAPDLSGVTSMREMFLSCSSLNSDFDHWETSTITDMAGAFLNATVFNGDITTWNTSNVVQMNSMLENCPDFNQNISGWNTDNLTSTGYMFSGSTSFNQDISGWNMSQVDFNIDMFNGATAFDQNLADWDISSMFDMSNMLSNSGMSKSNYDATLIGWSTLDTGAGETQIQTGVSLGASGLSFCEGTDARNTLIDTFSWTISGDTDGCLIAEYTFSGNANDDSGNGNNGTTFGGASPTFDRFGNVDSAISFDGVDGSLTTPDLGEHPTNISLSTWFYYEEGAADATHQLVEIPTTAALALFEGQFQSVLNLNGDFIVSTTAVTAGEWHHGAMTYDGAILSTYLDGVLVGETPNADQIQYPNSSNILQMGVSAGTNFFNGKLDEVRLHGRALTVAEITALYDDNPRSTLMEVYNSSGGDNWISNTNWGTNADLSDWHGVSTTAGVITSLDLRSNNLVGTIPATLEDLQALNVLILFNNVGLGGSIPPELGNLTNLTFFNISLCNLTGTIPPELGNLTNVTSFSLSRNQLSGAVPTELANLASASGVFLYRNQLTSLPDLTSLPAGFTLRVDENRIGFDDILANLPIQGTGSSYLYHPQTSDTEEVLTPAESESVTLSTTEVAAGTSYQWFYNGAEIAGATSASYTFQFTSSLEGTYYAEMTNSNVPDLTITRDSYLISDGVNATPTGINLDNSVVKEDSEIGTLVANLSTTDVDPTDSYTYALVAGAGDEANSRFSISDGQLFTAVVLDAAINPSNQIRIRTIDSGGAQFEQNFDVLVSPIQECNDDTFTAASGSFSDGSGDFEYENSFSCNWLIRLSQGKQVKLEFTEFNTEQDYDFVYVYDGDNENAPLIGQFSGASIPATMISSSNAMFITFISDGGVAAPGWSATYSTLASDAFYPFDGNANDVSGNGNNGTLNGSITSASDRFGNNDAAYHFDGASAFVQAPSDLTSNTPFSIVTWVKWDGNTAGVTEIVSWWNEPSISHVYLGTSITTGEIRFGDAWISTGVNLPSNEWTQVAATYDGSTSYLFLDGELVATSGAGLIYDFGTSDLYIGRQGEMGGEHFGGIIDEVRIYAEQLSASQIKNLFDAEQTDLIAIYNFSGDLVDGTSNGFDATNPSGGNGFGTSRLGFGSDAYDFDRTTGGAINLSNTASYDFEDQITVTGWIRPDSYDASSIEIMSNRLDSAGFEFRLESSDLSAEELMTKRRLGAGIPGVSFGAFGEVLLDRWTHIAFRYQSNNGLSLFVNGINQGTYGFVAGTEDSVITISPNSLTMGTEFEGLMDEIKIFDTALSDAEIYSDFESNRWPFSSLAFRGPEGGSNVVDQGLDLDREADGYIKALEIELDGTYQFRATADGFESFMGDSEGDGIAEPGGTQIMLSPSFYAIGFDQDNFAYSITEILSVGFIGSALTGDDTGWEADVDMTHVGNRVYELRNVTLFDGEWKIRINDDWAAIDWGSDEQNGILNYFGVNIVTSAGKYNITVDLLNNTYSIDAVAALVVQYNFSTGAAVDISGNGYDGVGVNGPQFSVDRFGITSGSFEPEGNGTHISINHNGDWDMQGAVTMNAWIRPNVLPGESEFGHVIFEEEAFGELDISPAGFLFYHWDQGGVFGTLSTDAPIEANQWSMVSLAIGSNDYAKLYINGVLQKVSLFEGATNVDSVLIQRHSGVGNNAYLADQNASDNDPRWLSGSIDDFRLYLGSELSAVALTEIYENELSGGLDELVAFFPFDGGDQNDQSGNSYGGEFRDANNQGVTEVTTTDRFGDANSALLFDNSGNSNHVFHERSINLFNDFTVNMWINPTSFAVGNELGDVLIANGLEGRLMTFENGILAYHYAHSDGVTYPSVATGTGVVSLSEWQMVTYSIATDNTIKMYHNGVLVATGDVTGQRLGLPDRFIMAQADVVDANDQRYYDGALDDVTIYQRTLSDLEVAGLFGNEVLIVDYPFDGNAEDESGNGNNATVTGASLTDDRFGNTESAYNFDGTDDYLTRIDANFLNGLSQGSISLWMNANSVVGEHDILNMGSARIYTDGDFVITNLSTDDMGASMSTSLVADAWSHIVLTYDGSMASLYQNAMLAVENASSGLITGVSSMFIGSEDGIGNFFNGEIDDVRIYSHALSQEEINDLNNAGGSTANDIVSFQIENQVGDAVIDANVHSVSIDMPFGTDRTSLAPTIGISELASITPASQAAQDFSDIVTYTVTAEDGSTQDWEVFLSVLFNDRSDITAFSVDGNEGVIDNTSKTVAVEVANGTDVTGLIASFELSEGAEASIGVVAQESGITSNDFTSAITYSVVAMDGIASTNWTVTVTESAADAKEILAFSFPEQDGVTSITDGNVELEVIAGTSLTNLIANFTLSGGATASIAGNAQVSGSTSNDFSNPLTYVVTASDASTKDWTVTVEIAPSRDTDITVFNFEGQIGSEIVNFDNHTVEVFMPAGTLVSSLTPSSIAISEGATVNPPEGEAQDFTNPITYTVAAQDGVTMQDWSVSVTLLPNNTPTAIALDNSTVAELEAAGTSVGMFTTADAEQNQTHTYSLVSGAGDTNNSNFQIAGDELQTSEVLSFADGGSRNILVQTDDGNGGQFQQAFTITITESANVDSDFSSVTAPGSQPEAAEAFEVRAIVTDVQEVDRVDIYHWRAGEAESSSPQVMTKDGDIYTYTMADSDLNGQGVQYFLEAVDRADNRTRTGMFFTARKVTGEAEALSTSTVRPGTTVQDYRIVAFPYEGLSVSVLSDDLGVADAANWRLLQYDGATADPYYRNASALSPGRGYWLIFKEYLEGETDIDVGGTSVSLNDDGVFVMDLRQGLNLIGNPFKSSINWSAVLAHNEALGAISTGDVSAAVGYNGSYSPGKTTLNVFEGAFINSSAAVEDFEIPVSAITGRVDDQEEGLSREAFIDNAKWDVRFFFATPTYSYKMGSIGMNEKAAEGSDRFDFPRLPKFSTYLEQVFADGNTGSVKRSDYFKEWTFRIPNNLPESEINLTWDVPVSLRKTILLVDGASNKVYDLRKTRSINLPNNPTATHRIYYGDEATIWDRIDLPFDVLYYAYPNPVENHFTLEVYAAENKNVPLELISLSGKSTSLGQMALNKGLSARRIDLSRFDIEGGIYFIKVDGRVMTKIFIK